MSLLESSIERIAKGLTANQQAINRSESYRVRARSKQLPPDTPDYVQRLNLEDELSKVRIVTGVNEFGKPIMSSLTDVSPEMLRDWFLWFILCGRGFGKTWTGASWINEGAEMATGEYMAILGRDAHDVRAYCVEGESGILKTARNDFYPSYEPSKRLITWPNGVKAQLFYAEEPKTIRGPNCFRAWADEPASYQDAHIGLKGPNGEDTAMSNLLMTLRKGSPQLLVTGTPKPLQLIKDLLKYVGAVVVRGGTRENRDNLSPIWLREMETQYEGTRLGRQELDGEVLDDNPGALVRREWIERARVNVVPNLERVVVAVDPAASTGTDSAKTGIIVAGRWFHPGEQRYHYYILADNSLKGSPKAWGTQAVQAYKYYQADRVVAERNNGGDMVESNITNVDETVPVKTVWASRGKITRAEPISTLYEQGRIHHVGCFVTLEDQWCEWEPGQPSPDELDASVWALTELSEGTSAGEDQEGHSTFWEQQESETEEDMMEYLMRNHR